MRLEITAVDGHHLENFPEGAEWRWSPQHRLPGGINRRSAGFKTPGNTLRLKKADSHECHEKPFIKLSSVSLRLGLMPRFIMGFPFLAAIAGTLLRAGIPIETYRGNASSTSAPKRHFASRKIPK
jgi:hypothetical protein